MNNDNNNKQNRVTVIRPQNIYQSISQHGIENVSVTPYENS